MAKANTKNQTEKIETPEVETAVTPVAIEASQTVAETLGAITDLGELEAQYKAMRKVLKGKAASDNKVAAIDLVTDEADEVVDRLIVAVAERGMRFTNFTIRYVSKSDTGSGYGDARGIKTVTGSVRMTAVEIEERDQFNAAEYVELLAETVDESVDYHVHEGAVLELDEWIVSHPSFTVPVVEESEENSEDSASK